VTPGLKALILAGGRGRRLDERTEEQNKCMLALLGRPLIEYSLRNAVLAGVDSIVVVVGYRAEDIINHYGTEYDDRRIRYVIQAERRGLVHAMECAREAIGTADFLLFLADEILARPFHAEMLARFRGEELFAMCGIVRVADRSEVRGTYTLLGDEESGRIYRLIEKPRVPINDICGTGNCVMRAAIFEYIERTPINTERGERELPDLIQCAVDEGRLVESFELGGGYINVNTPDDIARAEREYQRFSDGSSPGDPVPRAT
jgi:dTDP-glucose pyrophosphorylase